MSIEIGTSEDPFFWRLPSGIVINFDAVAVIFPIGPVTCMGEEIPAGIVVVQFTSGSKIAFDGNDAIALSTVDVNKC